MIDETLGQPLGPAGVAARMAELRAKLDGAFGAPTQNRPASFSAALQGQINGSLSGPIGPAGNAPLSPLGLGTVPDSVAPPELRALISQAATRNGLDPDLLDSLVHQESGYSPDARSKAGAMGLTQLMPDTAQSLGVTKPFDPGQSLEGGALYLKQQIARFGDLGSALAAYNAGPGAVVAHGGIPPYPETQAYVRNILSRYQQLKGASHGQ